MCAAVATLVYDSRDMEWEHVYWNGKHVWRDRTNYNCAGSAAKSSPDKGPWYLPWGGHRYQNPCYMEVTVKVKCDRGLNTMRLRSEIDQHIGDESWGWSNVRIYDKNLNIIADDSRYRYKSRGFDNRPPKSAAVQMLGGGGSKPAEGPVWTESQDEGTLSGVRNGYVCSFSDSDFHVEGDLYPFHCHCQGADPKPSDCQVVE